MTLTRKTQIALLAIGTILFVLLFLAPKTHSKPESDLKMMSVTNNDQISIEPFLEMAVKSLKNDEKTTYNQLLSSASSSKVDSSFIEVAQFWDKLKRPDFAAFFTEKVANKQQTSTAFEKAGNRYYYSTQFVKDNNEIGLIYQSAIRCYQKSIEKDKNNINAKIQLAACFVEGSQDPMKGISLLREVEKTDSNNVKLQLTFAFFSLRSQQWDKAIKRFEKVLVIDPLYIEAYLHLADAYEQQGEKSKTIEMLEKYASVTDDAMAKQEIKKYIEELKKNK